MKLSTARFNAGSIRLFIFDMRRGQVEGQEIEKVIFFYPLDCPLAVQLSAVGLSEGLITFTRIFSPSAACEVIEAERHSHVFYEAEPDIWVVMDVEKGREFNAVYRAAALRGFLKEMHSLFLMFHGPIRALLEKLPNGELARSHLYAFVMDYLADFMVGKKLELPSFLDCLKERATVQMLTVGRELAIEVQLLVGVIESCIGIAGCHSLILFKDLVVSTTLSPDDTTNIFTYAVLRLTTSALSFNTNSWSYLRKGSNNASAVSMDVIVPNISSSEDPGVISSDALPVRQGEEIHLFRAFQHSKWSKGNDGFLVTDIWGSAHPVLWIMHAQKLMHFSVYQHRALTVIVLIPVNSCTNKEQVISLMKQRFLENVFLKIARLEEKLSGWWVGENAYHVKGYRYLLFDGDRNISRCSPPGKTATLKKNSLISLNKLRGEVDLEKSRAKREDPAHEKDLEVCIRASNKTWIIARLVRGKELYLVLDRARETLTYASEALEKFSTRYCNGAFSLD